MLLMATGGHPGPSISGFWDQVLRRRQGIPPFLITCGEPRQAKRNREGTKSGFYLDGEGEAREAERGQVGWAGVSTDTPTTEEE